MATTTRMNTSQAHYLRRIWAQLPVEALEERAFERAILKGGGGYEHDHAGASAIRIGLTLAEAVTVRADDNGRRLYQRADEFPEWPDNGPGSEAFNRQLAAGARIEHEMLDSARRSAFEGSPVKRERDELVALIDERIDKRIREVFPTTDKPTVAWLRERVKGTRTPA